MIALSARRLDEAAELGHGLISELPGAGLLVVDSDARVLFAEGDAFAIMEPRGVVGRPVQDVVPAEAWAVLGPRYAAALDGAAQSFQYEAVSEPTVQRIRMSPIRDDDDVIGLMVITENVTETVRSAGRLADSEQLQRSVLDILDEGVVVTDPERRLLQANPAALEILGLDLEKARADPAWWESYNWRRAGDGGPVNMDAIVLETGDGVRDIQVEADLPDGALLLLSVNFQPLPAAGHPLGGLVLSFRDVTARTMERRSLVEGNARLAAAHTVARLASWELLPDTEEVAIFQALPGDEALAGTTIPLDALLGDRGSEDRDQTRDDLAACLRGDRDDTVRVSARRRASGQVWLETRSQAVRDADGQVIAVRGTTQDVTERELAKHKAMDERDFSQTTLDSLSAHIAVLDEQGQIIMTNRAWGAFTTPGSEAQTSVGANYLAVCDAADDDPGSRRTAAALRAIIAGDKSSYVDEYPCHGPGGEAWFVIRAVHFEGPGSARVVVSHEDVTLRRQAEARVATQAALLDEIDPAVVVTDTDGRVTFWNRGAQELYGWTADEMMGRNAVDVLTAPLGQIGARYVAELNRHGRNESQMELQRRDGSTFPASLHGRVMNDDQGRPTGRVNVSIDVSERVAAERAQVAARNYLSAVVDSMGEGMFTLDVDGRLMYMNAAAEGLLGWAREELEGQVMHCITHFRRADGADFPIGECPILQTRSGGGTVRVDDDMFVRKDGRDLPVAYTSSPFETEEGVEGCVVVFEDISERKASEMLLQRESEKLAWIGRIHEALAEDRFMLYAQPIVDLATDQTVQSELLLRLRDADGQIIGPGEYLGIAEEYGLIGEIDRWVIQRGIAIAATGRPVEINLSACSVGDPDILSHIEACLHASSADPGQIVFEITETAIIEDEDAALSFIDRLHALGCKLALDDFGTGYGGFTYLKQMPVDYLKIDIEFVRDLANNPRSRHVVEAVVGLARGFGLQTVAEGVEDSETYALIRRLGVDFAQGYFIARPGPLEAEAEAGHHG